MKIFIAARVPRGDAAQQALCERAARAVQRAGHTPFLAYQAILDQGLAGPQAFMPFVRQALSSASLLVLLYHPELRGGLIEAGMAYAWEKPVWLLHTGQGRLSSSARGIAEQVIVYRHPEDLEETLYRRLRAWSSSLPDAKTEIPEQE